MHETNISPPLSLDRFFLTQKLIYKSIYKSKIEKHIVSLEIFCIRHRYSQKPSSALINDWENNIAYEKNQSKAMP